MPSDARPGLWIEQAAQDLRYAIRALAKRPGFTAIAVLTLALGIGATTAIFSVVDAALIEPLPYPRPDRLVLVWSAFRSGGQSRVPASGHELTEIRRRSRMLAEVGGIWVANGSLTGEGEPEQVRTAFVTANFLSVLGVSPQLGRVFAASEEGPGSPRVLVMSDGLWRRRFGADRSIVGKTIRLDGQACQVIGIMPAGFELIFPGDASVPSDIALWVPFRDDIAALPRDLSYLRMTARLGSQVRLGAAQAEVSAIAAALRSEFQEYAKQGLDLDLVPLHRDVARDIRPILLALFGGVAMVTLIACANVANLLLARATSRGKEVALRSALGASRSRLTRQLLTESILLALLGGALGAAIGGGGLRLLLAIRPAGLARIDGAGLHPVVLAVTLFTSVGTGLLCGLAPVFALSRREPAEVLHERSAGAAQNRRFQGLLVLSEVALGFVLLVGSGLMVRSFVGLLAADPGFRADGVLTFQIALPEARYPDDSSRQRLFRELLERVRAIPGVKSAGAVSHLPLDDYPNWYESYAPDGAAPDRKAEFADHRSTMPGYFPTIGATLVEGRDFTLADDREHPNVIVVDESLARRTWPGQSALGKMLRVTFIHEGSFDATRAEVIGVVRHIRSQALGSDGRAQVYVPYLQSARVQLGFVVRAETPPSDLLREIRRETAGIDPELALSKVRGLSDYVDAARQSIRFTMVIASALAGLALLLACIGIFGLVSYTVAARTNEIGVRMALGSGRSAILWMMLAQILRLTGAGLAAGLVASFGLTRFLAALLYGVQPYDPATLAAAGAALATAAVLAAWIPARRATRVDPMVTLRNE
ncbi:MAG TPA: ABC transporter permease [Thermoanaerobaculia bacterium]